jgi:hypothetical protein
VDIKKECTSVATVESTNVLKWLNVVLNLNGVLCSCIQKLILYQKNGNPRTNPLEFYVQSAGVSTILRPKGVFIRPSLRQFLLALSGFANITIWSSMMQSTTNEVVNYLFHGILLPIKVLGQECCETI